MVNASLKREGCVKIDDACMLYVVCHLSISVQEVCLSPVLPVKPMSGDGLAPGLSHSLSCPAAVSINTSRVPACSVDCVTGLVVNSQL